MTCGRSVVFSGYSDFLRQDMTEILLKVVLSTITLTPLPPKNYIRGLGGLVVKIADSSASVLILELFLRQCGDFRTVPPPVW